MGKGKKEKATKKQKFKKVANMEQGQNYEPCAFDTLFGRSVPHILEGIFFSLDYKSFKNCMDVNKRWNELLLTGLF